MHCKADLLALSVYAENAQLHQDWSWHLRLSFSCIRYCISFSWRGSLGSVLSAEKSFGKRKKDGITACDARRLNLWSTGSIHAAICFLDVVSIWRQPWRRASRRIRAAAGCCPVFSAYLSITPESFTSPKLYLSAVCPICHVFHACKIGVGCRRWRWGRESGGAAKG
jgi:hypothetical protein